ncbi:MAG: hypothetical protein OXI87_06085 [Albidovulum sp.]|nr:hypothetical protein [Albidovulum sp.]
MESLVAGIPGFPILPRGEKPKLGSRTFSIVLGRMPEDWIERFGAAPVLIETFVPIPRYAGTVHRAPG